MLIGPHECPHFEPFGSFPLHMGQVQSPQYGLTFSFLDRWAREPSVLHLRPTACSSPGPGCLFLPLAPAALSGSAYLCAHHRVDLAQESPPLYSCSHILLPVPSKMNSPLPLLGVTLQRCPEQRARRQKSPVRTVPPRFLLCVTQGR